MLGCHGTHNTGSVPAAHTTARTCRPQAGPHAPELQANLHANVADCLEVLGKLATGVDVNIRCAWRGLL